MLEHRFESNLCSIENGVGGSERYWFTPEEEQEIQRHNEAFYLAHPEEELFRNHFRAASSDEAYEMLSLSEILEALKEKHGSLLRNVSMVKLGMHWLHREWNEYIPNWGTDISW